MPGGRRFRQAGPLRRRRAAPGQAHRPLVLARRDGDQQLLHGPFADPVFALRVLATWMSLLPAVEAAKPMTRHLDLAAVKPDLAFMLPQRCALRRRPRSWRSPQAAIASCSIISASALSPAARQTRLRLADALARDPRSNPAPVRDAPRRKASRPSSSSRGRPDRIELEQHPNGRNRPGD